MANSGPPRKTTAKHGHTSGAGWTDVPNTPYTGPGSDRPLPSSPGIAWFPEVEAWWEIMRTMPHCRLWEPSDWLYAIETAVLKNHFYGELYGGVVHGTMATEIRRREDQMGTTMEARRKNLIRYVDPAQAPELDEPAADPSEPDTADGVTPISAAKSRRERLAG